MYSAKLDGERVTFGTSGLLYLSNKLMYDRKTNSLWRQFTGEPVVGGLANSGIKLDFFPVLVTTWSEWLAEHPDTTVLDITTGFYPPTAYDPESDPTSQYHDYFASPDTMFPVWQQNAVLDIKTVVLGLRLGGEAKAYPLAALQQQPVVNDVLGGETLVVVTQPGGAARAYRSGDLEFSPGSESDQADAQLLTYQHGGLWEATEDALVSLEDPFQKLDRLPAHMSFWFGWFANFPDTLLYPSE